MDKNKWLEIYNIFKTSHSAFTSAYYMAKNGSNVAKRNKAQRELDNSIQMVKTWMEIHPELIGLLVESDSGSYQNAIIYDDFIQERYFDGNMTKYLEKMKKHIVSM